MLSELEWVCTLTDVCLLLSVSMYATEERKNQTSFDSILMIIIGGVAVALVLILVIVVIIVNRHHKQKNRQLAIELNEKK